MTARTLTRYVAAYKRPRSGRLRWLSVKTESEPDAAFILDGFAAERLGPGFRRYAGPLADNAGQHDDYRAKRRRRR